MDGQQSSHPPANGGSFPAALEGWKTRAALAEEIGISEDTIYRWEKQRKGPPCVYLGRTPYYNIEDFRAWMREQAEAKLQARKGRGRR